MGPPPQVCAHRVCVRVCAYTHILGSAHVIRDVHALIWCRGVVNTWVTFVNLRAVFVASVLILGGCAHHTHTACAAPPCVECE